MRFYLHNSFIFTIFTANKQKNCPVEKYVSINARQREEDFIRLFNAYQSETKDGLRLKCTEVAKIVATSPAPRFYITTDEALRKYSAYKRNGSLENVSSKLTSEMYMEIFQRFEKAIEKDGRIAFRYSIMDSVLSGGAPRFYISEESAGKFYYRAMANHRKRLRKGL